MDRHISPGRVGGSIRVPASKSHTIRALFIALSADGTSRIGRPLESPDGRAALSFARALGAEVHTEPQDDDRAWVVTPPDRPMPPENIVDVGNSGTTLYFAIATAARVEGFAVLTGDEQIRRRPAGPLLDAVTELGATAISTRQNDCAPIVVGGGLEGGTVSIECPTSQYLSALLLAAPFAEQRTDIDVRLLNEKPYVDMTVDWLCSHGVALERDGYARFSIEPGAAFSPVDRDIPGDWSSAAFFILAAVAAQSDLFLEGLDPGDSQGDKAIVDYLAQMGVPFEWDTERLLVRGSAVETPEPVDFDLNATPDALPAMALAAAFANGNSTLGNVPQARIKETDRIAVLRRELAKVGVEAEELPDGLVVHGKGRPAAGRRVGGASGAPGAGNHGGALTGGVVDSHGDHRIAMAFAAAALGAGEAITIHNADCAEITVPGFYGLLEEMRRGAST